MKFIGVMVLALFGTLFVSAAFSHADQAKLVNVTPLVCSEGGDHNISRAHTTRLGANNLRAVCLIWGAGTYPQAYLEVYHVTDATYVPRQGMTQWRYDLYVGYAEYTMTRKWTWELPKPPREVIPASGGFAASSQSPQQDSPTGDQPSGDQPSGDQPSGDEPSGDDPVTPPSDVPEDDNNNNNNGGNNGNNGNNNGNNGGGGSSCNNGIGNGGDGCDPGNSGDTPNGGQDD